MAEIIKRSTSNERNDPTIERVIPNSGRLDRTCGVRLHGTGHRRAEIPWRLLRRISFHRWRKVAKQFQRDAHLDKQTRETVRDEKIILLFLNSVIMTSSQTQMPRDSFLFSPFAAKHKTATVESSTRRLIDPTGWPLLVIGQRKRACVLGWRENRKTFFFARKDHEVEGKKGRRGEKKIERRNERESCDGQSFGINRARGMIDAFDLFHSAHLPTYLSVTASTNRVIETSITCRSSSSSFSLSLPFTSPLSIEWRLGGGGIWHVGVGEE